MANVVAQTTIALFFCVALFLSTPSSSHPISAADKCRSGCQGTTPTHFKYAEGTTYKYTLESGVDISLSSAEGQQSATKLKATVLLTQQPQCVQVLRLQNIQVFGSDGKKRGGIPNVEKPIKINFHDGHMEDIICAETGDTQVSLNIKRAVASLFQAAIGHHDVETDVFGVCPTDISTQKDGGMLTITKSRILNRCSFRESAKHDFLSTAFNMHSEIKSSPILKSDYTSEMRVKDGILDHVLVTENYLYMPFSIGKNGAKAAVQTKLQFTGKSKDAPKSKCTEPKSIIFESPHPTVSDKSNVKTILDAVKDTANSIKETVGAKTASKFGNLITVMSHGKKDDLLAVYNQVQSGAGFADKEKGKKVFLDALFRAGTGDCLEVAIQLLKSKQLSPLEEKMVYLGMSFIRHATPQSIQTASSLLDIPKLPREAYLGIGALTAHYCRQHDCHSLEQIKMLSAKLLGKLKDGKAANREQETEMIAVLKALANMKHLGDSVVPKLIAIAQDKKNSMRLRVAALEAYQSDACKDKLRDSATSILKDIQQDAEVRIKAYLALAECPTGKIATAIKTVLDNEPSYQVGGFIVSHIRNLRASANPDKELAKRELGGVNTMKKFPIDPRKFSFNDEFSYSVNTLGSSSSVESNVIYSQQSFLPRSTSLNLTTEIFGHKLNLLEVDIRQENLDALMEHYLGPLGVLRSKHPDELVKSGKASMEKIMEHVKARAQKTRGRRHVPKSEIDAIAKAVQIKTNDLNNDLDLDMSIKVFGSEFLFLTLNEEAAHYSAESIIDKLFDALDSGIEKAKNFQHTFTRNGVFLDAELSYPTSSGFPLKLSIEGTDSLQLIASTQMDIRALLHGDKSIMQVKLIPSANIEIAGRITLDACILESGLKILSSLHTATGGALVLDVSQQGIDAKLNLPVEKQDIINAEHQILFVTRESGHSEVEQPVKFVENMPLDICLDQASEIIGLTACVTINTPNQELNQATFLPYPLNGHSKLHVHITRDFPVTYHIRSLVYKTDKRGVEFVIETLDQSQKPKVSFNVEGFLQPELFIRASLDSPIKKAVLEGRVVDSDKEKSIGAKFVHDSHEYSGKIGVSVTGSAAKSTYKPLIEFITPEGKQASTYSVDGAVIAEKSGDDCKYTFDKVKLTIPDSKDIMINGNLGRKSGEYFASVKLEDGQNWAQLDGKMQASPTFIKLDAKQQNSMSPVSSFHVNYELKRDDHSVSSDLTLVHGADLTSKQHTLKLKNSVTKKYTDATNYQLATKNAFSYPLLGIEGKFHLNKVPKSFDYTVEGKYNKAKIASKMTAKYNQKTTGDYDVTLDAEALDTKLKAHAKRDISGDVSTIDHSLEINGKKAEVKGTVQHKFKPYDTEIGCDLTIQIPQCPDVIAVKQGFSHIPDECKASLKIAKGAENLIDFDLTAHKTKGGHGHIKAHIPKVVNVDGELKADKWKGKAHVVADFQFFEEPRKVKLESTFDLNKPKYDVAANLYPNFEKSPQKISVTSHNEIAPGHIDSKSKLDVFSNVFEVNVKGDYEGEVFDGKCNGEIDITLPNEMYFAGKLNRELRSTEGKYNGKVFVNLEQRKNKNTPGKKLTFKGEAKDTSFEDEKIDLTYHLAMDDSQGKNLNGDLAVKYIGENSDADITGKLYGSILPEPFEFHHKSTCKDEVGTYDINAKCSQCSVGVNGKFDVSGGDKPFTGSINVDVKTVSPKVKSVKLAASGKLLQDDDKFELGGSSKFSVDTSSPETNIDFDAEGDVSMTEHSGHLKGTVKVQKMDPITVAIGYGHKEENGVTKCQGDASFKYAEGKIIKADASFIRPNDHEGKLELKLETPYDGAKKSDIQINYKKNDETRHYTSDMTANVDGKQYLAKNELQLSEISPMLRMEFTHDGHTDKFYLKQERPGAHIYRGELQIAYRDFTYDYSYDMNVPSIDDFVMKYSVHCPKIDINNMVWEIKNDKSKGGKVIEVSGTSNGESLIKGSLTYKSREEGGKLIIEGSGEFTVKNDKQAGHFKYTRQTLTMEKHHEQGIQIMLDVALGSEAVDSEFKMTNKQFRVLNSYCKEKNQCSHFEIDAKSTVVDLTEYDNELEINVELASYAFGLKSSSKRKQLHFDHTTDVHFQTKDNKKYQYSLYLHPKSAGVSLTTPHRQVSLESQVDFSPKFKGPMKFDICFYLDKKNQPTKKTSLTGIAEYSGTDKNGKFTAETKLSSPGLPKEFIISYNSKYDIPSSQGEGTIVIDVFAKQTSKIVITGKTHLTRDSETGKYGLDRKVDVKSTGLGIDIKYEEIAYQYDIKTHTFKSMAKITMNMDNHKCVCMSLLEASPSKVIAKVQVHNKDIVSIDSKLKLSKEEQIVDTEAKFFGMKPLISHYELKHFNTMKYTLAAKDAPAKQLAINAAFIPGQVADFRITAAGTELVKASLQLDEANFLKPEYGVDVKSAKTLVMEPAVKEIDGILKEGKSFIEEAGSTTKKSIQHIGELAKKNAPNMKGAIDYYKGEYQKVVNEINADEYIKKLSELWHKLFGTAAKIVSEVMQKAMELIEQFTHSAQDIISKLSSTWESQIYPQVKETLSALQKVFGQTMKSITDIVFALMAEVSVFLDKHQAEFKQIATSFSTVFQDVGRFMQKHYERVRVLINDTIKSVYEEIKALPIYEELKARFDMLLKDIGDWSEPLKHMIEDALNTLRDIVPNEDAKKIIDQLREYIGKKLKNEPVDDIATIEAIVRSIMAALKKITAAYKPQDIQLQDFSGFTVDYLYALPRIVAAKFSPLTYLAQEEGPWDSFEESLYHFSFNPRSWFGPPFRMYAYLIQGQHIFTFDGKHLTFPGHCNYLLVRDAIDGNFTVGGTYAGGLLTAITYADATESVTIKKGGQIMHNKAAAEFPVRSGQIEAFRTYSKMHINSKAGVEITCEPSMIICKISISGFYHGHLRGLLGNGNNEPYDDFTTANGKIVMSESDFGNSYKMTGSCKAVKTVDHSAHTRAPSCTELFTNTDTMDICYPFVNSDIYRTACDHGVAAGIKDTEYAIARGYVEACNAKFIPAILPEKFLKCTNSEQEYRHGETFSVKLPGKAADIILIVDQTKSNEPIYKELLQPFVTEITKELGAKGITDVEFHLIGYGGEYQKWPSHYTSGGKLSWKGKVPAMKFSEPKHEEYKCGVAEVDKALEQLMEIKQDLELVLGLDIQARAFFESYRYPFRSHAAKTIVAFTGSQCKQGHLLFLQKLRALIFNDKKIQINLVTPFNDFKVKDAKVTKSVVGFDDKHVMTFADSKKKSAGSTELHKEMEFNDYCSDFLIKRGGAVFNADNFISAKGPQKQQFSQLMSHSIATQIATTKQGLDCVCTLRGFSSASNICTSLFSDGKDSK